MNYVNSLDFNGVAAKEIPCIKGKGAPTTATEGAVGCLYMDTSTGDIYKCTAAASGAYTWVLFNGAEVTQTTGNSATAVMSQKAVTDELDLIRAKTENLFNKDDADIVKDFIINFDGTFIACAWMEVTGYIPITKGKTYTFPVYKGVYGWTDRGYVLLYDATKTFIDEIYGTIADGIMTITVDNANAAYIRTNVHYGNTHEPQTSTFMFVEGDTYPTQYTPYGEVKITFTDKLLASLPSGTGEVSITQTTGNSESAVMSQKAVTDELDNIRIKSSGNLFNKDDADIVQDKIINVDGTFLNAPYMIITGFVPVTNGAKYTFPVYKGAYGWTDRGYALLYNTEKEFIGAIYGSITDRIMTVEVNNEAAAYIRTNVKEANGDYVTKNFMIVEGDTYPTSYWSYGSRTTLNPNMFMSNSPLYKKTVVFTGDSICHGLTDETGIRGWAQRIGEKHDMTWTNAAISGGTITSGLANSAGCIGDTDFGENPDYIIIEGGTNDADCIGGKDSEGNMPTAFGTLSLLRYTNEFDRTTFCGAVDELFRRVVINYKGAKIGFIIAHKMGGYLDTDGAGFYYTAERNNRRYYFETIIQLCKKWGIPYIDLWEGCYLNPMMPEHNSGADPFYYNNDFQHLTAKGYDYITPMIEKWMETL